MPRNSRRKSGKKQAVRVQRATAYAERRSLKAAIPAAAPIDPYTAATAALSTQLQSSPMSTLSARRDRARKGDDNFSQPMRPVAVFASAAYIRPQPQVPKPPISGSSYAVLAREKPVATVTTAASPSVNGDGGFLFYYECLILLWKRLL